MKKTLPLFLFSLMLVLAVGIIFHRVNSDWIIYSLFKNIFLAFRFTVTVFFFITFLFFIGIFFKERKLAAIVGILVSGVLSVISYPNMSFSRFANEKSIDIEELTFQKDLIKIQTSIEDLEDDIQNKLIKLRDEYTEERKIHFNKIDKKLPLIGFASYEELLRNNQKFDEKNKEILEIINLIDQAAFLENSILVLNKKIGDGEIHLEKLKAISWKMEKNQELKDLSQIKNEEIEELIDIANALIKNNTKAVENQDLGRIREKIFDRFNHKI